MHRERSRVWDWLADETALVILGHATTFGGVGEEGKLLASLARLTYPCVCEKWWRLSRSVPNVAERLRRRDEAFVRNGSARRRMRLAIKQRASSIRSAALETASSVGSVSLVLWLTLRSDGHISDGRCPRDAPHRDVSTDIVFQTEDQESPQCEPRIEVALSTTATLLPISETKPLTPGPASSGETNYFLDDNRPLRSGPSDRAMIGDPNDPRRSITDTFDGNRCAFLDHFKTFVILNSKFPLPDCGQLYADAAMTVAAFDSPKQDARSSGMRRNSLCAQWRRHNAHYPFTKKTGYRTSSR